MNLKIDTKEKFNEITVLEPILSANMTGEIENLFIPFLDSNVKNIVLSLSQVQSVNKEVAEKFAAVQQKFYEQNASFVTWGIQPEVEKIFIEEDLMEQMNVAPSLSEAWDIVQMEEIERELLDNF